MPEQIASTTDTLFRGLTAGFTRFMEFIPALLGALVVLAIGWVIAGWVGRLVERVLIASRFERAVAGTRFGAYLPHREPPVTASGILGTLSKWFIRLIFIQAAANILGMPQVTAIINNILLFIPNLFIALVILVVGAMLARYIGDLVLSSVSRMEFANPRVLSLIARYAIIGFSVIAAINQIGIATNLISILFTGLVGSLALALGLSFGLGGQGVASQITRGWYDRSAAESMRLRSVSGTSPQTVTQEQRKRELKG